MNQMLLLLVVAIVAGVVVFGAAALLTGTDSGLAEVEPDGVSAPLPAERSLGELDVTKLRFDLTLRGYRPEQVDAALRRLAYDLGYKQELLQVLESEVVALRDGRTADADKLRWTRESAAVAAAADEPVIELSDPASTV